MVIQLFLLRHRVTGLYWNSMKPWQEHADWRPEPESFGPYAIADQIIAMRQPREMGAPSTDQADVEVLQLDAPAPQLDAPAPPGAR